MRWHRRPDQARVPDVRAGADGPPWMTRGGQGRRDKETCLSATSSRGRAKFGANGRTGSRWSSSCGGSIQDHMVVSSREVRFELQPVSYVLVLHDGRVAQVQRPTDRCRNVVRTPSRRRRLPSRHLRFQPAAVGEIMSRRLCGGCLGRPWYNVCYKQSR